MKRLKEISDALRRWLIGAIKEGTAQPPAKPPLSGHVRLMRFKAASSLLDDGMSIAQAAAAAGVDCEEFRRWVTPRIAARRRVVS